MGLEGSAWAVAEARARYAMDIRHHYLDEPLPFDDSSFSAVVCNELLEHLLPHVAAAVLRESWRVLRPDGIIVVHSPSRFNKEQAGEATHINLSTPSELQEALLHAGFEDLVGLDEPRMVFGKSWPARALVRLAWRVWPMDWLSATASSIGRKPSDGS